MVTDLDVDEVEVLRLLADESLGATGLADALGFPTRDVKRCLGWLVVQGYVHRKTRLGGSEPTYVPTSEGLEVLKEFS